MIFEPRDLARLRHRYGAQRTDGRPPRDVDAIARRVETDDATHRFRDPLAILRYRLDLADSNDEHRLALSADLFAPLDPPIRWDPHADPDVASTCMQRIREMLG